jgi:hypothetical protein
MNPSSENGRANAVCESWKTSTPSIAGQAWPSTTGPLASRPSGTSSSRSGAPIAASGPLSYRASPTPWIARRFSNSRSLMSLVSLARQPLKTLSSPLAPGLPRP